MRTLHPALLVRDISASLRFYSTLGYSEVGRVRGTSLGDLTLLKLAGDDYAALELVEDPQRDASTSGSSFSHLAVQVESVRDIMDALRLNGFEPAPVLMPGGPAGPETSWVSDPDGHRIELTQWPAGHPLGVTSADF
ncbi:VOC family protein [Naasia lichenicola]|uniref:VOC family protein n=1 Tax=Naasia lichenicola TaxID=2565933 RepID=A0A4S4FJH7_9MICO|nr:VOC family protein [Naasia lichenicola]THG30064.1 VOC family protein [Naasia lichenicola]